MSTPARELATQSSQWHFPIGNVQPSSSGHVSIASTTSTVNIEDCFRRLADQWQRETGHLSLVSQRVNHPAYRQIIRMGGVAVPLILEELRRAPGHWFHALITLADENPIPPDFNGTVSDAADLWVAWGQRKRLIDP